MIFHKIIKEKKKKKEISTKPYNKRWKEQYNVKIINHTTDIIDDYLLIGFISYLKSKYKKSKKLIIDYYGFTDIVIQTTEKSREYNSVYYSPYLSKNINYNNYGNFIITKNRYGNNITTSKVSTNITQSNIFNSYKIVNSNMYGVFSSNISSNSTYDFNKIFRFNDVLYICEGDKEIMLMNRRLKIEKIRNGKI